MGKPFPSAIHLQDFARITSKQFSGPKFSKPRSKNQFFPEFLKSGGGDSDRAIRKMEGSERNRMPLSAVVSDCVKRWFQDTLKEARAGDTAMQVLVGQMYFSGYGIPRDEKKGRAWITKAARNRSSVWKVSEKRPGYNASDSDSDEVKDDSK
ncbi:hypothetical protein MRB53_003867 [Persea americana]|uniref:Uncharacterized protein n=1 Tax=Persea americana TaxID=3435 RepID=A0ACC2MYV3_PERAE|nr:hypothetical protein MRB53_003867 [Persea americana]|eukprot:TRINITY_DN5269_c0_g1_i1.p1 TRINITY_DN5269_c0_g1~~TRINITY_DN5269_c0_g1_i1.p1  ORF type:complete len:152 (+),score=20.09 TRINITY_DN5269_c0_g1_i1:179-634(+)